VAHYCSRECQEKDYPTHKAEGPAIDAVPLGKDGGGAMEVEPAQRGTLPRERRVAKGSILGLYAEEIDKLVAVSRRREELMRDPGRRAEFVKRHRTRETILMAATRELADQNAGVQQTLDDLFEVEAMDTEERMTTYHILERKRVEAYARRNGLLLNWTEYSNIVRLRELAAYQLAVGAGEDVHGETTYCEQGLRNGDRARRLLTEFLLRPSLDKHETGLYQRYEAALAHEERQRDHVKQYVEDFFPYYWQRVEDNVVEMVRETFAPKEGREPSVPKRPASGEAEGGGGKRPRTFGVKGAGGGGMAVEEEPLSEDMFEELVALLASDEPTSQAFINKVNRVRTGRLNERIQAVAQSYEEELEGGELGAFHQELLSQVKLDARIAMDTIRNSVAATSALEGEVAAQDRMLGQMEEKHLEKMDEAVRKKDSSLWGRIKDMGNWVWPRLKEIAPFVMFTLLIGGTVGFMLYGRAYCTTVVTPDAHLAETEKIVGEVGDMARSGKARTDKVFARVSEREVENTLVLDQEALVMHGENLERIAQEEYLQRNYAPNAFAEMKKCYVETEQSFTTATYNVNAKLRAFVSEGIAGINRVEAEYRNASSTTESRLRVVSAAQDDWQSLWDLLKRTPEYQAAVEGKFIAEKRVAELQERLGGLFRALDDSNEVLKEAKETLGVLSTELDEIVRKTEEAKDHLAKARDIIAEYGEKRPLMTAFVVYMGKEYEKYLHPGYALHNAQLLSAWDVAIYTAVLSFSSIDIALSGVHNILRTTVGKGVVKGAGVFFAWTVDWGNLGAARTVLSAIHLVTQVAKAAASVPVRRSLDELTAIFQYDYVKPLSFEDLYFLSAIRRERPDLPEETQQLYVRVRESALLGRFYSPDIYQSQFVEREDLKYLEDEEIEFLQQIVRGLDGDLRHRYLRGIYRNFFGDWSYNTTAVILGLVRNVVDFAGDTTEKTLAYIGVTTRLAGVGHIFMSSLSVIQVMWSLTNLVRYAVMCCDVAMTTPLGIGLGAVGSSMAVVYGMYYLTARLYREMRVLPDFKERDKYWCSATMYLDVVLTHAWKAPTIATTVWKYGPHVVLALDTALSIICTVRGIYYPNTRGEFLTALDPVMAWSPKFIREYVTNDRRVAFLESPRAVTDTLIELSEDRDFHVEQQKDLVQVIVRNNATLLEAVKGLKPSADKGLWAIATFGGKM
jgi:hypothetical protein